jgi:large subunit ribosomal protein L3
VFDDNGRAVAVTVVEAGPCVVVQRKTADKDGYEAIQVGFDDRPLARTNQPLTGHFRAHGVNVPKRHLREFRLDDAGAEYSEGQELTVALFEAGQAIEVVGTTKGRGFTGVVKRHHFHGGPASHGSKVHRVPMSGGATDAARVFKGHKNPGHMGAEQRTVKGLRVFDIDAEHNLIVVRGAIPGPRGGLVVVLPAK